MPVQHHLQNSHPIEISQEKKKKKRGFTVFMKICEFMIIARIYKIAFENSVKKLLLQEDISADTVEKGEII